MENWQSKRLIEKNPQKYNQVRESVKAIDPDEISKRLIDIPGIETISPGHDFVSPEIEYGRMPTAIIGQVEEAIVDLEMRPPYLIQNDQILVQGEYGIENAYEHMETLNANRSILEKASKSVGRLDLLFHPENAPYAGTGWLIDETTVVTNRHVAEVFAQRDWSRTWPFMQGFGGRTIETQLNFLGQHESSFTSQDQRQRLAVVEEVLYVADYGQPDYAFLRIAKSDFTPLTLQEKAIEVRQPIATIGYPASDGTRNDVNVMQRLFKKIYDVKRFSPGEVDGLTDNGIIIHDCTTLGGSSGSAVISLETGKVCGLHYSGKYRKANKAVSSNIISAAYRGLRGAWAPGAFLEAELETPSETRSFYRGRRGYKTTFLGKGSLAVPLPETGTRAENQKAPVAGSRENILKYQHFSIAQSKERRLPIFTAVNIDGRGIRSIPDKNTWRFDARLSDEHQVGNELYKDTRIKNPLDRGHMVRRLDPCWGSKPQVLRAQDDTYHYTNSAPQHKGLNRRHWVRLEDYILNSAKALDFKVSVFTGPVFGNDDPKLKSRESDVPIPQEYWKVAVLVNKDTGKLAASAYVLSQGKMLGKFTEAAFVFGQYETYQVPVSLVERETGLDFGLLKSVDTLGAVAENESSFGILFHPIFGEDDVRL